MKEGRKGRRQALRKEGRGEGGDGGREDNRYDETEKGDHDSDRGSWRESCSGLWWSCTEDGLNCLGGPGGDSDNNQQTQWSDTAASCNIKGRVRRATSAISASQARIPSHWMALVQVHRGPL